MAAAAKFVPDRDISLKIMAVSGTIILLTVIAFAFFEHSLWPENEEGPIGELPVEWVSYFGKSDYDRGECVRVTRDGGYLVVGHSSTRGVGLSPINKESVYLLKISSNGTLLWERTYGVTGWDVGRSVIEVEDGYVITGYTNEGLLLMKTDDQGETMWSRTYVNGSGFSVEEAGDGGYVVVGISADDVLLLRTDEKGEMLWNKTYGGAGKQLGFALQVTRDGGYLIGGITGAVPVGNIDFYVLKTDSHGEIIWSKTMGGSKGDWLQAVLETPEDGVLAVGGRVSLGPGGGAGGSKTWVVKLDKNGEILWSKTYPGSCGYDAQRTSDGGYVILSGGVLLMKIDGEGNLEWSKAYRGRLPEAGRCLQSTNDGGYIVTGYQELTALDTNIILVKIPYLEK